jgi:hypothetical protein
MELIDRRGFLGGFLFGTAVAAAALTVCSETVQAMPLDDHAPGALDGWIMKAQAVVVRPVPRRRPRRRVWPLLVESRPTRLRLALGVI